MTEDEKEMSEVYGARYTSADIDRINRNARREALKTTLVVEGDLRKEQYLRVLNSTGFTVAFFRGTAKVKRIGKWHYSVRATTRAGDSVVVVVATLKRLTPKKPRGMVHVDLRESQQLERSVRKGNLTNTWHDQNLPYQVKP